MFDLRCHGRYKLHTWRSTQGSIPALQCKRKDRCGWMTLDQGRLSKSGPPHLLQCILWAIPLSGIPLPADNCSPHHWRPLDPWLHHRLRLMQATKEKVHKPSHSTNACKCCKCMINHDEMICVCELVAFLMHFAASGR